MWYLIAAEILICGITTIEFIWKFTSRIQKHARKRLEEYEKDIFNFQQSTWYHHHRTKEDIQVFPRVRIKTNGEIDITHILVPENQLISTAESQVLIARQQLRKLNITNGIGKEFVEAKDDVNFARKGTVNEIAKKFEKNDSKIKKVHTASSCQQKISKSYFEGPKTIKEPIKSSDSESMDIDCSDESDEVSEFSTPPNTLQTEEDFNLYLNGDCKVNLRIKSVPVQNGDTIPIRGSTSPVDTIEEILAQQRFSRTLSAYSITDLIKDIPNDIDIDEFINSINK